MTRLHDSLLPGAADFPRNQWYVAACSDEITRAPFTRRLLGEPVLLYRTENGEPVALFDRCPHRGLPLSKGKVIGDVVQCTYHGMCFDRRGRCTAVPSSNTIPERMRVPSYPLVEAWEWIWIWMGDPAAADANLIPDLHAWGFGRAGWYSETSVLLPVAANYLLPFENLLDASHITYLHNGQIDAGNVAAHPFSIDIDGRMVRVRRDIHNEKQSPLTMKTFGFSGEYADRSIISEALVPSLCGIRVATAPVGQGHVEPQVNQLAVGITPRDRTSSYEFTAVAQTFPFVNPQRHDDLRNLLMEDVVVMEAIQALFDQLRPEQRTELSVKADEAAVRARRIIAGQIEQERAAAQ
jgi:vanillate O-demethylase monooxygenase subunit